MVTRKISACGGLKSTIFLHNALKNPKKIALTLTENHFFLVMKKHIYGPPKSIIFKIFMETYIC